MRDVPKSLYMHLSYAGLQALKNVQASPVFDAQKFSQNDVAQFVAGVKKYQGHAFVVPDKRREIVWQKGAVTLQQKIGVSAADTAAPLVLLVPSLINGAEIFDVLPQHSFMDFLVEQGAHPFLLDWGEIVNDEAATDLRSLVVERLVAAAQYLHETHGRAVHVLGYCLGGVLSCMAATHTPECIASLTCLATPWDFEAGEGRLRERVRFFFERPDINIHLQSREVFPADWMHHVLATLNPEIVVQKFVRFAGMDEGSAEEHLFVAVEDWLASSADMKMGLVNDICRSLMIENGAHSFVDAAAIDCPVLIVASQSDKMVEFESAKMLHKIVQHSELVIPSCGHIGMMAGRKAKADVWYPFLNWICMQEKI